MRVTVLGVGDAFDPDQPNSSVLVDQNGFCLLIDCGPTVLPPLWRARPDPDAIDAIYLTHHHADHVAGLPSVLERWSWGGRQKCLTIVTTEDGARQVTALCALLTVEPRYKLHYATPSEAAQLGPFAVRTAPTSHVIPNLALHLAAAGRRLGYSGDGRPTEASRKLYRDTDLLLHECWEPVAPHISFHADLETIRSIDGPARIGLYHVRAGRRPAMRHAVAGEERLFLLEPGDELDV